MIYDACEEATYLMARQKASKFSSSLDSLRGLLTVFYDDLMMIGPAAVKYEEAKKAAETEQQRRFVALEKIKAQGSQKQSARGPVTTMAHSLKVRSFEEERSDAHLELLRTRFARARPITNKLLLVASLLAPVLCKERDELVRWPERNGLLLLPDLWPPLVPVLFEASLSDEKPGGDVNRYF